MEFQTAPEEISHQFQYQLQNGKVKNLSLKIWLPVSGISGKKEACPLILFSHGYLGAASQSLFLTQFLAANGYIVAAPEHTDALFYNSIKPVKFFNIKKPILQFAEERLTDMKASLDELLKMNRTPESQLFGLINENAVGAAGHSLGGWTAVGLSGGIPNYHEPRIKAALYLAPFIKDYTSKDFKRIPIPQMHILGEKDLSNLNFFLRFVLLEKNLLRRTAYDYANPDKFLLIIKKGTHFTFTDWTCLLFKDIPSCQEKNSKARLILQYSLLFFESYLMHKKEAKQGLLQKNANLFHYEYLCDEHSH
jgi:predicted dienelactone hydrolase